MTRTVSQLRKVVLFNLMTLDGFVAGPGGALDWHNVDEEFNDFAIAQLDEMGALLFGRVTYQLMASYWSTAAAGADDPIVAGKMNSMPKFVFSKSLSQADWNNTTLVKDDAAQTVGQLTQQPGQDLILMGSANLASTLINQGLIDEYRLLVNPVVLGQGLPLFQDIRQKLPLKLLNTRTFRSGNVLLYYQPVKTNTAAA